MSFLTHALRSCSFFLLFSATFCITTTVQAQEVISCQAVSQTAGPLTISVDPRIELLAVIQSLADYRGFDGRPVLTRFDFPYKDEIANVFGAYGDHPAVTRFHDMSTSGFWYSHPPTAMLHLSDPPKLVQDVPFTDFVHMTAGGTEKLRAFVEDVRQFSRDTDFISFFNGHRAYYEEIIQAYLDEMKHGYTGDLEEYYGFSQHGYTIVLASLLHPGGFGPRIEREPGLFDAYYIGGPREIIDGKPSFGTDENIQYICWHEFSHSFVNHQTDRHIDSLRDPILALQDESVLNELEKSGMEPDVHVTDWVSEHIVRGVTSRLAFHRIGADIYQERVRSEISQGFPYVAEIAACLERYERDRDTYPTLASFYPELVAVFETLAAESLH